VNTLFDLATDIIVISRQLVLQAEASQWEEFTELDAKRQSLVRSLNLEHIELSDQDNIRFRSLMNEMISLNEQLGTICTEQRSVLAKKLTEIRLGAKATEAYS
jgi:two-component sensor histidine kinase